MLYCIIDYIYNYIIFIYLGKKNNKHKTIFIYLRKNLIIFEFIYTNNKYYILKTNP